jgi:Exonuclease
VEGNGAQPPDLVELAVVPITGGIIGEPSSWLAKPDTPITYFARKVHGITNDAEANAPVFADVKLAVLEALTADGIIAHNGHVDVGVLQCTPSEWECPKSSTLSNPPAACSPTRAGTNSVTMTLQPFSDHQRGLFISVDGPSGAGKSTIVEHLAQMFVAAGKIVHVTAEAGWFWSQQNRLSTSSALPPGTQRGHGCRRRKTPLNSCRICNTRRTERLRSSLRYFLGADYSIPSKVGVSTEPGAVHIEASQVGAVELGDE